MSVKRKRKPTAIIPSKIYDLNKIIGPWEGGYSGGDELDDAMRQARKIQADKLKGMLVEKTTLEVEKEVKQLRREVSPIGGEPAGLTTEDVQFLSQLPEDQRGVAIQAMAAFKSTGGQSTGSLGPLLMVSLLQKKPETGVVELVTALKGLNEIVQTGKPQTTNDVSLLLSIAKMLGDAKDTAYQTQIQLLQKQMEDIKPHDPLEYQKQFIEVAKGIGFQPATGALSSEVERMKMDHEKYLQKSNQDFTMIIKKMDRDDDRMSSLITLLTPVAAKFADVVPAALAGLAAGAAIKPPAQPQGSLSVKCPQCGYEPIFVSEEKPVAECPKCKLSVTHERFKDRVDALGPPTSGSPPPPPPSDMR